MSSLPSSIGGEPIVLQYGENTDLAVAAAAQAEAAAATAAADVEAAVADDVAAAAASAASAAASASILSNSAGNRAVTHGYDGALNYTGGSFADPGYNVAGDGKTFIKGQSLNGGTLRQVVFDVYSVANGDVSIIVGTGADPSSLVISDAQAIEVTGTGKQRITLGTPIVLDPEQWYGFAVAAGGPNFYGIRPGDNPTYKANGTITSGTQAFTTFDNSTEMFAQFIIDEPALSVAVIADDDTPSRALGYLLPDELPMQADVFLVAGQSNAERNSTDMPDNDNHLTLPTGIAKLFFGNPAADPSTWTLVDLTADPASNANGRAAWIAFARDYFARTGRMSIFVLAAQGGSGLIADIGYGNWSASGTLRARAVTAVNSAMTAATGAGLRVKFGAVLWWQGEADALRYDAGGVALDGGLVTQAKMLTGLQGILSYFQGQFGAATQMIVARIGYPSTGDTTGFGLIRAAIDDFVQAERDAHLAFIAPQATTTLYHYTPAIYNRADRQFAMVAAAVAVGRA